MNIDSDGKEEENCQNRVVSYSWSWAPNPSAGHHMTLPVPARSGGQNRHLLPDVFPRSEIIVSSQGTFQLRMLRTIWAKSLF